MRDTDSSFNSFIFGEGRTGIGQAVEFTCRTGDTDKVKKFLRDNVRDIDVPITGRVSIAHGGYGMHTRYDVVQHDYAGGGPDEGCGAWSYIEVLEIKNPPDGRWGMVVNECTSHRGSAFTEWETLEAARSAFKTRRETGVRGEEFSKLPGCRRRVVCGLLTPWFYAIGDQELIGDYAFPEGLQDDPVYCFGKKFVVFGKDKIPTVKTCMGARVIKQRREFHPYDEYFRRFVTWDDGTVWDEENSRLGEQPRPIEEDEAWIAQAVQEFRELLTGKKEQFVINFTDGDRFVGRFVRAKPRRRIPRAEGRYDLVVKIKGESEPHKGWVDFKPTAKAPDVIQYITQAFAKDGKVVEHIEIKGRKTRRGGKKWAGAFFRH